MQVKRGTKGLASWRGGGHGRLFVALVALASGGCELTQSQEPANVLAEGNLAERCAVKPPFTPNFEPEVEWAWTGSTVMPEHSNVMMTPVVVDVNGDGVSDVVFNSYAGTNYDTNGILRAISGANGQDLWTVTDPVYRVRGAASIAAGDIDHDGKVEICTVPETGASSSARSAPPPQPEIAAMR